MPLTDALVLPADVLLLPVKDLPKSVRQQVDAEENDYALTRPRSRTPSRIVDQNAAELLRHFRQPITIVQAVIHYSREKQTDPEQTLEEAYPLLERLAQSRWLVPPQSEEALQIQPSLEIGSRISEAEVLGAVQILEDTELYQARTPDGQLAALKILRPNAGPEVARMFDREAAILERLNGSVSPKLLGCGTDDGRRYLLIQWCSGADCSSAASDLRSSGTPDAKRRLVRLCANILNAYARLHEQNVLHSDIHPRNVLVDDAGDVKLIDFGVARIFGMENQFRRAHRAGVGFFFEPEYASAVRGGKGHPYSSAAGEQYALAALIYTLCTGAHYLDFSLEKDEMLRQITEDAPVEFTQRGLAAWPELEQVLHQALSKDPSSRFASVAEIRDRLNEIADALPDEHTAAAPATTPSAFPDAEMILQRALARFDVGGNLFAQGLSAAPKVSVNYGSAGVAYALYLIACARDDSRLMALADLWSMRSARDMNLEDAFYCPEIDITANVVGHISPYHTASGIYVVQALIGHAMGDIASQQLAVDSFLAAVQAGACDNHDVTLGRSGPLLSAAWLLDSCSCDKYINTKALLEFGSRALNNVCEQLRSFATISECQEINYSGAAHGWAGILYSCLCWCRSSRAAVPEELRERLEQLAAFAEVSGKRVRWRWNIRRQHHRQVADYMSGWCNGSAGFVFLWTLAHRMLERSEYATLAEKAACDSWESDSQTGNLCCGYAGQAYALVNLYKYSGDVSWLHRAQALAQRGARATTQMPNVGAFRELISRPDSLYKGELGIAILAAQLQKPKFASMPFFEADYY
jgi:eukaryotic-like serine/threonine-protein kinase